MARVTSASAPALLFFVRTASATLSFYDVHRPVIDGCFFQDHKYIGDDLGNPSIEDNYTMCQLKCQHEQQCQYFTHFSSGHCWLNGKNAIYDDKWAAGAVTGPKYCPVLPSGCTEVPGPDFPGDTADHSEQAWPSHRIPEKLECWPRNETQGWYDSCPSIHVLEDTENGWPSKCKGLYQVPVTSGETCESLCRKKITCSVFQVMNDTSKPCWHGEGVDCFNGGDFHVGDLVPSYGARVMHGEVRVLADLTGVQIMGLQPAFDAYYFLNQSHDAVNACRNHCYSNAECEYWQYSESKGCWAENPDLIRLDGLVEYPITTRSWLTETDFAASVIAGEYIQHVCKGTGHVPKMFSASYVPSDLPMGPDAPSLESREASSPSQAASSTIGPAPPIFALSLTDGAPARDVGADFVAASSGLPEQEDLDKKESFAATHGSWLLLAVVVFGILAATFGLIRFLWPQVRLCDEREPKSVTRHVELEEGSTQPLTSASDDQSWRPSWLDSQSAPSTSSALPFPEAGIPPPRQGLPFPEVGFVQP